MGTRQKIYSIFYQGNNKRKISAQINSGIDIKRPRSAVKIVPETSVENIHLAAANSGINKDDQSTDNSKIASISKNSNKSNADQPSTSNNQSHANADQPSTSNKNQSCTVLSAARPIVNKNITIPDDVVVEEPKLPVFYDPDVGLYVHGLEDYKPIFTFQNCHVSINGSGNTLVFNNCSFEDKSHRKNGQ